MVTDRRAIGDRGSVLVITLVLTVILAVLVLALANFVTVGLRTSDVASERTESNADASAVMSWAVEQFAKKQLTPAGDCGEAPTYVTIPTVPASLSVNGSTTTLECAQTNPITGESAVHLIATSTGEQIRVVEATVLVPLYSHGARVADWRVDIPIDVPDYVTTTTAAPGTTTTTSTAPNVPPTANATAWFLPTVATPTSYTLYLDALDPDGTITGATIVDGTPNPPPSGVVVSHVSGNEVTVTLDDTVGVGLYNLDYTVTDGTDTSGSTIELDVSLTPPATTTTLPATTTTSLAPNLGCTFEVTSAENSGKSGIGQLQVTNTGGSFAGAWEVRISQLSSSKPWSFTWPNPPLTATSTSSHQFVNGNDTLVTGASADYSAELNQNGNPKIAVGTMLTCVVLSP